MCWVDFFVFSKDEGRDTISNLGLDSYWVIVILSDGTGVAAQQHQSTIYKHDRHGSVILQVVSFVFCANYQVGSSYSGSSTYCYDL